jgi:dGTPase
MPEPSTAEAMVARWSDRIAYVSHDVDDAIRAGVLREEDLPTSVRSVLGASYRDRLDAMVSALVAHSSDAVRMPADVTAAMAELRSFLFERVYLGPAREQAERAANVLKGLCEYYRAHASQLPPAEDLDQRVIDYVSGMTDRFALKKYEEIFLPRGIT